MANKPFNAVDGYSVGANASINVIDANGNVYANYFTTSNTAIVTGNLSGGNISTVGILTVTGNANVGNIGAGAGIFTNIVNVSGGTITGNTYPLVNLSQTWNNAAVDFAAFKVDITDSGSVQGSRFLDFTANGTSKYAISRLGRVLVPAEALFVQGTDFASATSRFRIDSGQVKIPASSDYSWCSTSTGTLGDASDIRLSRDAAGTLAQRLNGAAQTLRVYNTWTDAGNAEYAKIDWKTSANVLLLGTANIGTGIARNLIIQTASANRITVLSTGNVGINTAVPAYTLEVTGTFSASGNANVGNLGTVGNITAAYYFGNGSQLTGIKTSLISNGTSNVSIPVVNSNVNTSVGGVANILVITTTGANLAGTLNATGNANLGSNLMITGNVGIGTTPTTTFRLEVNGAFAATTKSFVIPHPTKEGKKLRYGSLEGPENGIYVRGRLTDSDAIILPDYWVRLAHVDTISVQLTPIGKYQKLYVKEIANNTISIGNRNLFGSINCFYIVYAERKDVARLEVEY